MASQVTCCALRAVFQRPGHELPGPSADLLGQRLIRHGLDGCYGKRFDLLIAQLLCMHHQFAAVQGACIVVMGPKEYLLFSEIGLLRVVNSFDPANRCLCDLPHQLLKGE